MSQFFGEKSSQMAKETYINQEKFNDNSFVDEFRLGSYNTRGLLQDPKRFGFLISRHKFVGKMLDGAERVLEIGCQEGLGSLVVSKFVGSILAVDFYKPHIEEAVAHMSPVLPKVEFRGCDILDGPLAGPFDAAFSLDVFEHIDPAQEDLFLGNIAASLTPTGTFICGIPSLESQAYASPENRVGHINCKSGVDFRTSLRKHFHNVYMFGMNDEIVHTGFFPMCQYLIGLCVNPINR